MQICEDSAGTLAGDEVNKPLAVLIPKFLGFFRHGTAKIRGLAVLCVNSCLLFQSDSLNPHMDAYLGQLFALANDPEPEVQLQLCRALTLLLDAHLDRLVPHLPNIVEFMLMRTQDGDENTALEACEFWLALAEEHGTCRQALQPILPKLIPVLLASMRYSEMDVLLLKGDVEDAAVPDKAEDIKPRFHHSKLARNAALKDENENEESDEEGGGGGASDPLTDWNLRKCAAASLDVLSNIFGDELLPILLPLLKDYLFHEQWEVHSIDE